MLYKSVQWYMNNPICKKKSEYK